MAKAKSSGKSGTTGHRKGLPLRGQRTRTNSKGKSKGYGGMKFSKK